MVKYSRHLLELDQVARPRHKLQHTVVIHARPPPDVTHSPISGGVDQPANLMVVTDGPRALDEFETEGFSKAHSRIRQE